jgi:DNA-binding IclR family transcriptional regulator
MPPEYSAETTVTESALLKRVTDHWRRTREPVNARVLAELAGWDDGQVRRVLRRMEAKGVIARKGQRGGWLPVSGREAGQGMAERKAKTSNRQKGAARRAEIYEFIVRYADELDGPTPSIREVAESLHLDYSVTWRHVQTLIAHGKLRSERGKLVVVGSDWIEPKRVQQMEFEF